MIYNFSLQFLSGTHDLQQAYVKECACSGSINVTGVFADNSNAMGYFLIVYSETGIPEHFEAVVGHQNESINVGNLPKGNFRIAMFDIGKDGLPKTQAAIYSSAKILDGSDGLQGTYQY